VGGTWARITGKYTLTPSLSSNVNASIFFELAGSMKDNDYGISLGDVGDMNNNNNEDDNNSVNNYALGLTLSTLTSRDKGSAAPFLLVSGGWAFNVMGSHATPENHSLSAGSAAYKAGGGVILNNRYLFQIDYSDYGVIEGERLNGWGVSLGSHF
jgi:hypothetical protein